MSASRPASADVKAIDPDPRGSVYDDEQDDEYTIEEVDVPVEDGPGDMEQIVPALVNTSPDVSVLLDRYR